MNLSVRFVHGLGDCSNFVHQVPLLQKLGSVELQCENNKLELFAATGAKLVQKAKLNHPWYYPPGEKKESDYGSPLFNKNGCGLARLIGDELAVKHWQEYLTSKVDLSPFVTPQVKRFVDPWLATMAKPIVLFAPMGTNTPQAKNWDDYLSLCQCLLDEFSGTIVLLDWDRRVIVFNNSRLRHLEKDFRKISLPEFYYLTTQSQLMLAVDTGPLHFARFSNIPTIGLWTGNQPWKFALPRPGALHITTRAEHGEPLTRLQYQVLAAPGPDPCFVVRQVLRMLEPRRLLPEPGQDCLLRGLLDRQGNGRGKAFGEFLGALAQRECPCVVEAGCVRSVEDWSAGYSTYLLGFFLSHHGGCLTSVDQDQGHVDLARRLCPWRSVEVVHSHSLPFLASYVGPKLDAIYLDSSDSPENCLEEARLALPHLEADAVVMIDDSPRIDGQWTGKGQHSIPFLSLFRL